MVCQHNSAAPCSEEPYAKLINLIQTQPSRYKLVRGTLLEVSQSAKDIDDRIEQIESLIETLSL